MQHRKKHNTDGVTVADFPPWEQRTKHTPGPCSRRFAGDRDRRALGTIVKNGVEYTLHATKGIRRARQFAGNN